MFQDVLQLVQAKLAARAAVEVQVQSDNDAASDVIAAEAKTETLPAVVTPVKTTPTSEVASISASTSPSTSSAQTAGGQNMVMVDQIHFNKDFKLGGIVGDGKNCLGYGTIYYRMLEGKNNGYKPKAIMAGVVRAMQPGSELGQYFERHPELEWNEFLEILRNRYQLENYGRMLMNLGKEFQKPNEEAIDFAYRITRLRDDILAVGADENAVVDRKMVQEQCLHGLSVGLRSNTIRMELRQMLSDKDIKDPVLFREVTAASLGRGRGYFWICKMLVLI